MGKTKSAHPSIHPTIVHPSIYLLSVETLPLEATNRNRAANETRPSEPTTRKSGDVSNVLPMETEALTSEHHSLSTTKEDEAGALH